MLEGHIFSLLWSYVEILLGSVYSLTKLLLYLDEYKRYFFKALYKLSGSINWDIATPYRAELKKYEHLNYNK